MRILFQGDSITDWKRVYDEPTSLGEGYVVYSVDALKNAYSDIDFEFINKGISGNRTENLLARIQGDLIDLQPDIVTLLLGVNDTWHKFSGHDNKTIEQFCEYYELILQRIKNETHAKLVIMEPFLVYNMDKDNMRADLDEKIDCIRKLAMKYADAYIPLDGMFASAAVSGVPCNELAYDGVHPEEAGKKLICNALVPVLTKIIDEIRL